MRFWIKLELGGPRELKDSLLLSSLVPRKIRKLYTEAKTCFEAGAYQASVVMLRAASEKMLDDGLAGERLLTSRQVKIVNRIKELGNRAAHGKSVSSQAVPSLIGDLGSVICSVYKTD